MADSAPIRLLLIEDSLGDAMKVTRRLLAAIERMQLRDEQVVESAASAANRPFSTVDGGPARDLPRIAVGSHCTRLTLAE